MAAAGVPTIKHIGTNGQISLGKKYAGKQVSVVELEDGTILLKPGKFIPDNELWLYANNGNRRIDEAMAWHDKTSRRDNYDEIIEKIENV